MGYRVVFGRKLISIVVFNFWYLRRNKRKPKQENPLTPGSLPFTFKGPGLTLLFPSQTCWCWNQSLTFSLGSLPNRTEKPFIYLWVYHKKVPQDKDWVIMLGGCPVKRKWGMVRKIDIKEGFMEKRLEEEREIGELGREGGSRSVVFQKPGQWCFLFVQHKGTSWPDQGPTRTRKSSLLVEWAKEKRGREDERRANVKCRRKISGKSVSLISFFASDMSTGMVGNVAYNFRVIIATVIFPPSPSQVLPLALTTWFHSTAWIMLEKEPRRKDDSKRSLRTGLQYLRVYPHFQTACLPTAKLPIVHLLLIYSTGLHTYT